MKNNQKYIYILLISAILLLVSVFAAQRTDPTPPCFYVQSPYSAEAEDISIFDAEDGNYYVFLPSYADMGQVTVSLTGNERYSLGTTDLVDSMNCSGFETETPYAFAVNKQTVGTLWFYQSANVATMYIDTATGSMYSIHEDKSYEEFSSLQLYTPEGTLDFQDDLAIIKGRGNSTQVPDKRPYSLVLSDKGDLLDMGQASSWVLLANGYDETNLNNKLVLDLASRVGFQWTPECRWVDLYLNGEYSGLYLLAEKVEVHENRLNIDTNSEDFLCTLVVTSRWHTLRNPFLTEAGRTIEICAPKVLTKSEHAEIQRLVNQMEQSLLSETDLQDSTLIDLDSWVRRYLIDEISGNVDSDHKSSYFYYSGGKFYAGPLWDYDFAFGNTPRIRDPHAFLANNLKRSDVLRSIYHATLYSNPSFHDRMVEIYRTELRPLLQELIDSEFFELSNFIDKAAQSNSIRWRSMFDALQRLHVSQIRTPEDLHAYLSVRISFLDSAWLDNTEYCTVQFEVFPGAEYLNTTVQKGACLDVSSVDLPFVDLVNSVWVNSETGAVFDISQPITSNLILSQQIAKDEDTPITENANEPLATRDYITLLSIAALFILLVGWMMLDIAQRRKERKAANEAKQAKVST